MGRKSAIRQTAGEVHPLYCSTSACVSVLGFISDTRHLVLIEWCRSHSTKYRYSCGWMLANVYDVVPAFGHSCGVVSCPLQAQAILCCHGYPRPRMPEFSCPCFFLELWDLSWQCRVLSSFNFALIKVSCLISYLGCFPLTLKVPSRSETCLIFLASMLYRQIKRIISHDPLLEIERALTQIFCLYI